MAKPQYGAAHRRRRADWAAELTRTGGRRCACRGQCRHHQGRCREWITAGSTWDLGHGVASIDGGDGTDSEPMCRRCNRGEGNRLRRSVRVEKPSSEDWW